MDDYNIDIDINSIDTKALDTAELRTVELIREKYPHLDLRYGTALREILIRPEAAMHALAIARAQYVKDRTSLNRMKHADGATAGDINNILSNFNIETDSGARASGIIRVDVALDITYSLPAGITFRTLAGYGYTTTRTATATSDPTRQVTGAIPLKPRPGGFYFLLPVTAEDTGDNYNIAKGTALDPVTNIYGYVSATAYTNFTSGANPEALDAAVTRIPEALSHRGLVNRNAVAAQLAMEFDDTEIPPYAVSVQGYGSAVQLRDRRNMFGISVGNRIDIYVRTSAQLPIIRVTARGKRIDNGTYLIALKADEIPGLYAINAVTDVDTEALGTYNYTETRDYDIHMSRYHDIHDAKAAAYTRYQTSMITVDGVASSDAEKDFVVSYYGMPGIAKYQDYVDSPGVASLGADIVVRSPLLCLVSMSATVRRTSTSDFNINNAKSALVTYINSRDFLGTLSRAELAAVLTSAGAQDVDLRATGATSMLLSGSIRGADGAWHTYTGDSIDISTLGSPSNLIAPESTVFATDMSMIDIKEDIV